MKQLLIVMAGILALQCQASAATKTLTCENISLVETTFTACEDSNSDVHGGVQPCGYNDVVKDTIVRVEITSNPGGVSDTAKLTFAQSGEESVNCSISKEGGQDEVWCTASNGISLAYLPSSYQDDDYYVAFFLKDGNSPAAIGTNPDNCVLQK